MTFLAQKQNTNCMFEIFLMLNIYLSKNFLGLIDLVLNIGLSRLSKYTVQYKCKALWSINFLNMKPNQNYN